MQRLFGADKMDDTIGILSIIIIVIQLVFLIGSIFPTEKSLTSNVFLDLPLTIKIFSLLIAGLDPLNASKNPITSPATS